MHLQSLKQESSWFRINDSGAGAESAPFFMWGDRMKYLRICLAALLLTGCAAQTPENQSRQESSVQESEPAPYDDGWRDAYAAVLRGTVAKRFSLVYINDDDIPEMSLHFSDEGLASHADFPVLYIYSGGTAENLGSYSQEGNDQFGYVERKGIVINAYTSTGAGYQQFLRLENGALVQEHQVDFDATGMTSEEILYMLDGKDCTTAEYEALHAQYYTDDNKITCGDYAINEENILAYVLNS